MDLRDANRRVQLPDLGDPVSLVNLDPRVRRLGMDVEKRAVRSERLMNPVESVDDARWRDSSEGPGEYCHVKRRLGEF